MDLASAVAAILLLAFILEVRKDPDESFQPLVLLSILGIAFGSYVAISNTQDVVIRRNVRYVDWILTTPLLVYNYWSIGQTFGYRGASIGSLIFADIMMIVLGYLSFMFPDQALLFNVLSFLALGYILYDFYKMSNYLKTLNNPQADRAAGGVIFFYLWPLYGIVHSMPAAYHDNLYGGLDAYTKAGYAFYFL